MLTSVSVVLTCVECWSAYTSSPPLHHLFTASSPPLHHLFPLWPEQERSFIEALQEWHSEKIIDLYVSAEGVAGAGAEVGKGASGETMEGSVNVSLLACNRPCDGVPLHMRLPAALTHRPAQHPQERLPSKRRTVQGSCLIDIDRHR